MIQSMTAPMITTQKTLLSSHPLTPKQSHHTTTLTQRAPCCLHPHPKQQPTPGEAAHPLLPPFLTQAIIHSTTTVLRTTAAAHSLLTTTHAQTTAALPCQALPIMACKAPGTQGVLLQCPLTPDQDTQGKHALSSHSYAPTERRALSQETDTAVVHAAPLP